VEPLPTPAEHLFPPSQAEIIVLDDQPMILDEGALEVEDDALVANDWDDVIEVGDEVVFDA
jgi:hypothetical protein